MKEQRCTKLLIILGLLVGSWVELGEGAGVSAQSQTQIAEARAAEARAVAFLLREVPAWSRENGCFSCHNNGDAARALFQAARQGYDIPAEALRATQTWLAAPQHWDENKGDPGFSDKRLADVQFAAAWLTGWETGQLTSRDALPPAAHRLLAGQDQTGAWPIEAGNVVGSPATYGTPLATWQAWRVLQAAQRIAPEAQIARAAQRAETWLRQRRPQNVMLAATLVLAFAHAQDRAAQELRAESLQLLQRTQTRDGGWGPYANAPPEAFDTALVLLAFAQVHPQQPQLRPRIQRGRQFLAASQNPDGSWPATTRPSGGDSYAQLMSTTGWATQALLATR